MEDHLGYAKHDPTGRGSGNSRNGSTAKTVRGDFGEARIRTPCDRESSFDPKIVPKRETSLGNFADKIVSLYAHGMTTREIEEHLQEMYGIEVSPQFISRATDQLQQQIVEWQSRPLDRLYPVVCVDGLRVPIRTDKGVVKKCVYVVLGVATNGRQEVLVASQRCRTLRSGNRNLKPDHWSRRGIYTLLLTQALENLTTQSSLLNSS